MLYRNKTLLFSRDVSVMSDREFHLWKKFINTLPDVETQGQRPDLLTQTDWANVMRGAILTSCTQTEINNYFKQLIQVYPVDQVRALLGLVRKQPWKNVRVRAMLQRVCQAIEHALYEVN